MSTTIKIENKNEMVEFLREDVGRGSSIVSLVTETEVKMRKKGNPYYGTVKVCQRIGLINVNFVKAVRRRISEIMGIPFTETVYIPGETWYKHVTSPLMVHKDDSRRFYVQFFPFRSKDAKYFLNGKELTPEQVKEMKTFINYKAGDEFKPPVIVLAIDSVRVMKVRTFNVLNDTVNRLAQRLSQLRPAQKRVTLA